MNPEIQGPTNTSSKNNQGSTPSKQTDTARRSSLPTGKFSASVARPQARRAKSSSLGPKRNPPKLPPKSDNVGDAVSPQTRKSSTAPRRPTKLNGKPSAAEPKRKPPKLPPKKNDEKRPAAPQARKSSAILKKDIQARMERMDSQTSQNDQQDLKSILSDSQCKDLTRLASAIMDRMRRTIEDNFDATATLEKIRNKTTGEDNLANIDFDPGTVDVGEYDKERKLRDEWQKELSRPKLKELKKWNLRWFDDWRAGSMRRVTDAVSPDKKLPPQQTQIDTSPALRNDARGQVEGDPPPKLEQLFPRVPTSLTKLPIPKRELILHSFLLLLLSLENYNAASRVFLLYLTSSLKLGLKSLRESEEKTAKGLLQAAKQITASQDTIQKGKESEESRRWKMRLATVAGAAIVGLSGGYAAPLIAASVGTMMSELGLGASAAAGYLGSVAGNTYLVGSLFGAYGGRMTSEMMRNLSADVQDFAFLPVHGERKEHKDTVEAATDNRRLRVIIAISGWLLEKEEVVTPWRVLSPSAEVFALRFELETLMKLGQSINTMTSNSAYGYAQSAFATRAAYTEISSAIWPIALVKIARVVENPFSLAKFRAEKAGRVLAEALIKRTQGERPVTLVGYSLGARVIWSCLRTLAERRAFGLIESAVLIGSPIPSDTGTWRLMRTAVSGRLVNVYSTNDYLLAFLHRASSLQYGVAGLTAISGLSGVENFDLSETVSGHLRYRYLAGAILQRIGFEGLDKVEISKEAEAFKKIVEEEKKHDYVQEAKDGAGELYKQYGKRSKQGSKPKISDADANKQASAMEKEVQQKTQTGLMQWAVEQLYISRPPLPSTISPKSAQRSDKAKTPDKGDDTATKSMYQRAKEAVYLTRSGASADRNAAKGKADEAQDTATSAAPNSYLTTAAGYIPTGYIPTLRGSGRAGKAVDGSKVKQAAKKAPAANEKTESGVLNSSSSEKGKVDRATGQKTSSAEKKPKEDAEETAKERSIDGDIENTMASGTEMQQQAINKPEAEGDVGSDSPKAKESTGNSVDQAPKASGVTSYIPSFGFGSSSKSSKESIPEKTPSTSDDPGQRESSDDKTAEEQENGAEKPAKETPDHGAETESPKEKPSGYGSYIPSFSFSGLSAAKPKNVAENDGKVPEVEESKSEQTAGLEDPFVD